MRLATTLTLGVLGVVAYRAWQQHRHRLQDASTTGMAGTLIDDGRTTPPHGDPRVPSVDTDLSPAAPAAQSSRGFGDED